MKNLSPKKIKILGFSIILILASILAYGIIDLTKVVKSNKEIQVVSMYEEKQEHIQDNTQEENVYEEVIVVYLNNIQNMSESYEEEIIEDSTPINDNSNNEQKQNDSNTQNKTNIENTNKYYIKVNCEANVVTIYTKDSEGNYTVPYKAMVCSTGTATTRYLKGKYAIKGRWEWGALYGDVYGHYCVHIVDQILFHSVPYLKASPDSLEYWEYDKLGTSASAGCIRLTVEDAKWIYNNIQKGTIVEFYSSSDPGPLR